jgi:FkbM family methyltransferase
MDNLVSHLFDIVRNERLDTAGKKAGYLIDVFKFRLSRLHDDHPKKLFGFEMHFSSPDSLSHLIKEAFIDFHYFVALEKEKPIIFDIGSNIGITVLFFKKLYPKSIIYSFEPDPDTFALLKNNIEKNNLRTVFPYNAGMSNVSGKAVLYIPSWSNGSSSLFREKIEIEKGYAQACSATAEPQVSEKEVDIIRCSDFLQENRITHIDLLKIDVEGAEENIIDDISAHLDLIDFIVLEFHYAKDHIMRNSLGTIIAKLEEAGFIVSVNPTWMATEARVMCTYLLKAVNGNYRNDRMVNLLRTF